MEFLELFQQLAIYGGLFLGILLIVDAIFTIFRKMGAGGEKHINRRLKIRAEMEEGTSEELLQALRLEGDADVGFLSYVPFYDSLERLRFQSQAEIPIQRLFLIMGVLSAVWFLFLVIVVPVLPLLITFFIALLLGVMLVVMSLVRRKNKRRDQFAEQLPDALDLIVRSLRVGHPLSASISVVASEMPDPIGTEFGIAFDEITYGQEVPESLHQLSQRVPVEDLSYLSVAVQIQSETGGNLSEILGGLSVVIRERFRMFRKVRAITAEGRFSAWFLAGFPVVLIFAIQMVKPDYYTQIADFPLFPHLVVATVFLLLMNVIAMRIIVNIKV